MDFSTSPILHLPTNSSIINPPTAAAAVAKVFMSNFTAVKPKTLYLFLVDPVPPLASTLGWCCSELVFVSQSDRTGSLSSLCKPEGLMQMPCDAVC